MVYLYFQRYRDILRSCKTGKEPATSSVLFKKPYLDKDGAEAPPAGEGHLPLGSRDLNTDAEDGDPDDYEFDGMEDLEQPCNMNQQAAVARTATRIALYMMREELGDSVLGEKQHTHAHDFFVVNSCKVFCKAKKPPFSRLCTNIRQDTLQVGNILSDNTASNIGSFKMEVSQSNTSNSRWSDEQYGGNQSGDTVERCEKPVFGGQVLESKQEEADIGKQKEGLSGTHQGAMNFPNDLTIKNEAADAMDSVETSQDEEDAVLHEACRNEAKDTGGEHAVGGADKASEDVKCAADHGHSSHSELKLSSRNKDASAAPSSKDDEKRAQDILLPITHKEVMNVLEQINW
jgi:hypothetical protein